MLEWSIVSGLVLIFAAYLLVCARKDKEVGRLAREAFLRRHEGWDSYVQAVPMGLGLVQTVLAVNHESREIILGTVKELYRHPWSALVSVEVVKNGHAVASFDRGSQLAGAAVGGMIAGDAGLVAGGLSGRSITRERVCDLGLKIVVDDRNDPAHTVMFLHLRNGLFTESDEFRNLSRQLDHFHALVVNAIRAEQRIQSSPSARTETAVGELERLWRLKEIGALTEDEFVAHKGKLVATPITTASPT